MLKVTPIPCLEDNYAYLLDDGSGDLALVDPSEGGPVFAALEHANALLQTLRQTARGRACASSGLDRR